MLEDKKKVTIQCINDIAKRRKVSKRKSENLNMPKRKSSMEAGWRREQKKPNSADLH